MNWGILNDFFSFTNMECGVLKCTDYGVVYFRLDLVVKVRPHIHKVMGSDLIMGSLEMRIYPTFPLHFQ